MVALGRARQAKGRQYYKGDVNLPAFLTAQNLKPFISNVLEVTSSQIEFRTKNGGVAYGYTDDLLPEVCDVFIRAVGFHHGPEIGEFFRGAARMLFVAI